jgi:outer membrane protein
MPRMRVSAGRLHALVLLAGLASGADSRAQQSSGANSPQAATNSPTVSPTGQQEPQPPKITLHEALEYAAKNQPAVKAALARLTARQVDVSIPRGQWLPSVGLTAQLIGGTTNNTTASYLGAPLVPIPRIGGTPADTTASWSPQPSTFAGLGVIQEVFDFGRITAEIAAADSLVVVERRTAEAEALSVRFGVEEAYFTVNAAKAVLRATEDGYARELAHLELARAGVASGLRPPIDVTRADAQLQQFDIERIRARGSVRVAQIVLAASVGSPEPALDIADAPPAPAEMPSLDTALKRALDREPLLRAAIERIQAQEDETRAQFAKLRPDLLLAGTLNTRAGGATPSGSGTVPAGNGWIPNVPNWQVGILLNWPLFEGTLWAAGQASQALEAVRREEAALVRESLVVQIGRSYIAVEVARTTLKQLEASLTAAIANYAQADARFKAGLGTSVEIADAEALRTNAEVALVQGQLELARARAAFGRAIAEEN